MKILALESSAQAASAALAVDGRVVAEAWQKTGLTHSETLLPMAVHLLETAKTKLSEIDLFAVANGPGSFTGLRIGVAAVKGLALGLGKPCAGISTLYGMYRACAPYPEDAVAVCTMDARVGQVYCAAFDPASDTRITPDRAMALDALREELITLHRPVYLVGDGAEVTYAALKGLAGIRVTLAPEQTRYQRASGVALAAAELSPDAYVSAGALRTEYHRLPQAERERLERLKGGK